MWECGYLTHEMIRIDDTTDLDWISSSQLQLGLLRYCEQTMIINLVYLVLFSRQQLINLWRNLVRLGWRRWMPLWKGTWERTLGWCIQFGWGSNKCINWSIALRALLVESESGHETDAMDQWIYFWILIQTGYISLMSSLSPFQQRHPA